MTVSDPETSILRCRRSSVFQSRLLLSELQVKLLSTVRGVAPIDVVYELVFGDWREIFFLCYTFSCAEMTDGSLYSTLYARAWPNMG